MAVINVVQQWLQDSPALHLCIAGAAIGFAFGWVLQRSHFCVMGALSDAAVFQDTRRLRAWLLAIAVAILGAHALDAWQIADLSRARYLGGQINWLGQSLGGFVFGIGMVLAGGCSSRNLARAGAGDLRSLVVVLVVATFAFGALSGVLAPTRVAMQSATAMPVSSFDMPGQGLADVIGLMSSAPADTLRWTLACLVALALLVFIFKDPAFRSAPRHILSGLVIGLLVVTAWAVTGLAFDELADRPVTSESLSFVAPVARTLDWVERASAIGMPGFGASVVMGTLLGSLASAVTGRTFRWQTFANVADTARHLTGAALMGIGGIFALGCTIGQGISGLSTLSLGSIISVAGIVVGALVMVHILART